jgi:hypothetical protein
VLGDVPKEQRCRCREEKEDTKVEGGAPRSFLERLLGV